MCHGQLAAVHDEDLVDLKSLKHKVFDGRKCNNGLSLTQAHIQEKCCNRVRFNILGAVTLIIVWNELHSGITSSRHPVPVFPAHRFVYLPAAA